MVEPSNNAVRTLKEVLSAPPIEQLRIALGDRAELHLVGGAVRDALRGSKPTDLDFCSALSPDDVIAKLEAARIHTIPTGRKHQTVTAVLGGPDSSKTVEITTFHGPGMRPAGGVIAGHSIQEDLAHRDFTVNAIAFSLTTSALVDFANGISDIQARTIRAVGDPYERFAEDPLRTLRMVRIGCQLGFNLESGTSEAARHFAPALELVSAERVRDEFSKILISGQPDTGLRQLLELGFLPMVLPELLECVGVDQNRFHKANVFDHTLEVVAATSPELVLRLAALFHDIAKPRTLTVDEKTGDRHFFLHEKVGADMTREALARLKFPNSVVESVATLVYTHMRPTESGAGGMRRLLRDTGELFPIWRELKEKDTLACNVDAAEVQTRLAAFDSAIEEIKKGPTLSPLSSLAIDGSDLIAMGLKPSPLFGQILRALHERVLDNPELNSKELLLELARRMLPS